MNTKLFNSITDALVKDGYIIIQNSLEVPFLEELLAYAKKSTAYKQAGISKNHSFTIDNTKRSDKTLWLNSDNSVSGKYLSLADRLKNHLNRSLYLGLRYYEAHFSLYEQGDFYEKHLDSFKGSKNRIVTTVLYLNKEWKEEDGGELLLYTPEGILLQKVLPEMGTLIVFLSDVFPHEVAPAKKKRHAIAGWFRVDKE
jgi:SM-20-related protein